MSSQSTMKLAIELRQTIRMLHKHFKGRNGNPTVKFSHACDMNPDSPQQGEISPYRRFLVNACKEKIDPASKSSQDSTDAFLVRASAR
eukprot:763351-Hanusia_phi.AAC.2